MSTMPANPPLFGLSLAPNAADLDKIVRLSETADTLGVDLLAVQDHPYNGGFVDTWTLLALLGGRTQHIRLLPDVLNLPLRPPAMLAKAAATLDRLTEGRVELGLGAGAAWEAIAGYGGPVRTPAEALVALREAIAVIRALWQPAGAGEGVVSVTGRFYSVTEAQPGPAPAHPIGIWLGANGPRALRLTGELADGWIISAPYWPVEKIAPGQALVDAGAAAAGRPPAAIRRAYNMGGVILAPGQPLRAARPGVLVGPVATWVDTLVMLYAEQRLDTFIFWPAGGDAEGQLRRFAAEVIPAVRARVRGRPN